MDGVDGVKFVDYDDTDCIFYACKRICFSWLVLPKNSFAQHQKVYVLLPNMQSTSGTLERFGGQANDSGSYGTFYPAKFMGNAKPTGIGQFIGVKEIIVEKDITRGDCEREVATLSSAQSEFVVTYYDSYFNAKKKTFYIYTEMCSCSLDDILQRNKAEFIYGGSSFTLRVPPKFNNGYEVLGAYIQVFKGMEFLHTKGIIHRDIKPANILKSLSGTFKICDFGLAKIITHGTRHTTAKGSEWYSAPEKRHGGDYDIASDVYSAGVSLLEGLLLFAATETGKASYNNLSSARGAFRDKEMRAYIDSVPAFRLAHAMMSRKPSDRPTMGAAIVFLSNNDYRTLPDIPSYMDVVGRPVRVPDKTHYQFADRFFKGDSQAGAIVIKMADHKEYTVDNPANHDYILSSDCLYFHLTDGSTGFMKLVAADDD